MVHTATTTGSEGTRDRELRATIMSNKDRRRQLMAASIGNILEYYDFVIYAFVATTIAHKFFPSTDEVAGLLASFAAFGVGFLARPLGGIVIGRIADVMGRRFGLLITIFGMATGTVGIGLLPTFETIGILAPILLVLMRLIQGLAAGGEWGSAVTFIVESAPDHKRGWFGSIGQAAIAASTMLASGFVAGITNILSEPVMQDWGWRVPFLFGGLLFAVGIWMRSSTVETPAFEKARSERDDTQTPIVALTAGQSALLAGKAFGFSVLWTVSYYIMLNYMPTYLTRYAGVSAPQALWGNSLALLVVVVTTPLFGLLSDRIGRKPLMLAYCLAFIILPWPLFSLILGGASYAEIVAIQVIFNLFLAASFGAGPAAIVELFPTQSRTMLLSIGYGLSAALFGGFGPFIATWLIATTGNAISPVFYLMGAALVSFLVIMRLPETAHNPLR